MIEESMLWGTFSACLLFALPLNGEENAGNSPEFEFKVTVPDTEKERGNGALLVEILVDGSVMTGQRTISPARLEKKLAAVAAQYENQPVLIRADGSVRFERIVGVIDICQKAGIRNISFATQRPAPAE